MSTTLRRIALRADGAAYYALEEFLHDHRAHERQKVHGDGQLLAWVRKIWYKASSPVDTLEISRPDRWESSGWKLPEGVSVVGAPAGILTDEQLVEIESDLQELYVRSGASVPVDPIKITAAEWTWLEGEPPADDFRVALWRPNLPSWLEYGPEYSHVFPGSLVGFRTAMLEVVERLVDGELYVERNGIKCFASYKYSPPRYHEARRHPRSRPTTRESSQLKTIFITVRQEIQGKNLADALAKWDAARTELEDDVRRQACVKLCSACGGKGVMGTG